MLYRPPNFEDIPEYNEVQKVLREEIVNPLRKNLFVRADKVMKLRKLLDNLTSVTGLMSEEKGNNFCFDYGDNLPTFYTRIYFVKSSFSVNHYFFRSGRTPQFLTKPNIKSFAVSRNFLWTICLFVPIIC